MRLPNFLIVGAAKSGTTSLFHYLKQHSEVYMPTFKEPQYFVSSKVHNRVFKSVSSLEEYKSLFSNVNKELVVGEASVFYLYFYKEAIKNILKTLDSNVKIIIVLRNPVDRAYSAYRHVTRNSLTEKFSFEQALIEEPGRLDRNPNITPMVMYQDMSLYNDAVKAYKSAFKNVHIILHKDLKNNLAQTMQDLCKFLNINHHEEIDFSIKHNVGSWDWDNLFLKNILFSKGLFKSTLKFIFPDAILKSFSHFVRKFGARKSTFLNKNIKLKLQSKFKNDIELLSKTINKDLKHWTDAS